MATIDNLDLNIYRMYAMRTRMIEQINQEYRLQEAASIPPQTQLIDTFPKMTELDLLLGVVPSYTPWAYFFPPKQYRAIRRSSFTFSRIIPSIPDDDAQAEIEERLASVHTNSLEDEQEKTCISTCLKQISKLNDWLGFIVGRVGQFLQG